MVTIYAIRQISKNKYYIGSTIRYKIRKGQHLYQLKSNNHHSRKLQKAWNKYGKDDFEFIILLENLDINEEERTKIEEKHINKFDSYKKGFNGRPNATKLPFLPIGGNHYGAKQIVSYNIETGEIKHYDSISGVSNDNLCQYNVSTCCRNKILRVKNFFFFYKENLNLDNLKQKFELYNLGRGHKLKGRKKSKSTINKISKKLKGRKLTKSHRDNIFKNTPKGSTHPSARKIIRSDGKIYDMIKDAAKDTGIARASISQNLSGRSKLTGGYTFKYLS